MPGCCQKTREIL